MLSFESSSFLSMFFPLSPSMLLSCGFVFTDSDAVSPSSEDEGKFFL